MRALLLITIALGFSSACAEDAAPSPQPIADAQVTPPVLDGGGGGALEDRITIPNDPRDAAITERTPVLDLPLVVGRPSGPLSTATLDVLVLDEAGLPLRDIGVTTGGPAVFTSALGIARVTAVYGAGTTDVFAFGAPYALTHAEVVIREAQTSAVILTLALDDVVQRIEDAAQAGPVAFENDPEADPVATLVLEADAFELPWGGVARGSAYARLAVLDEPAQAAAVPGNMRVLSEGELLAVAGVMSFELLVTQGATELALRNTAEISLAWPSWATNVDRATQQLFRFDPSQSAFVEAGSLRSDAADPLRVIATIDQLGHWLIGAPITASHCARIAAVQGDVPLAHGNAQLTSSSGLSASRIELDAAGEGCAALPDAAPAQLNALARIATGLSWAKRDVGASEQPMACSADCALVTASAQPIEIACVRGTITTDLGVAYATVSGENGEWGETLATGQEFCLELPVGAELAITSGTYRCGEPSTAVESPGTACGADGCLDLGELTCCQTEEYCGVTGAPTNDDDCDGLVDEGCNCGGAACGQSPAGCCEGAACGEHSPFTDACISIIPETFLPSTTCPTAEVPLGNDDTAIVSGCCLMSGVCGLMWEPRFFCVPPADVTRLWGDTVTPPSMSCTF